MSAKPEGGDMAPDPKLQHHLTLIFISQQCTTQNSATSLPRRNLLKVVFATGTLAAGINMPARTTVISALGRMTDDGPQLMPHNELLQMAGRAGRRGYDTAGFCVVLQTR
jgi:superfamily II helicase